MRILARRRQPDSATVVVVVVVGVGDGDGVGVGDGDGVGVGEGVGDGVTPGRGCSIIPTSGTASRHVRVQNPPVKLESTDQKYETRFGPIETSRSGTVTVAALEPPLVVRSVVTSISRPSRRRRNSVATSRRPSDRTPA